MDRPVSFFNDFFEHFIDLAEKKENEAKNKKWCKNNFWKIAILVNC